MAILWNLGEKCICHIRFHKRSPSMKNLEKKKYFWGFFWSWKWIWNKFLDQNNFLALSLSYIRSFRKGSCIIWSRPMTTCGYSHLKGSQNVEKTKKNIFFTFAHNGKWSPSFRNVLFATLTPSRKWPRRVICFVSRLDNLEVMLMARQKFCGKEFH